MRTPHLHLCACAFGAKQCASACPWDGAVFEPLCHSVTEFQAKVIVQKILFEPLSGEAPLPVCGSCQMEKRPGNWQSSWRWPWLYELTFILSDAMRAGPPKRRAAA